MIPHKIDRDLGEGPPWQSSNFPMRGNLKLDKLIQFANVHL